jgi:large subunit ribosomal protein L19e
MTKMNLRNKKRLASEILGAGRNRIRFDVQRLSEIKEAITKQDIRDLYHDGFIEILPAKGRKRLTKRKNKKGAGNVEKKVSKRKQTYVKITRKLRAYLKDLKNQDKISKELYWATRKKIKMRTFKSKASLKEYIEALEKQVANPDVKPKNKKKSEKSAQIIQSKKNEHKGRQK